MKLFCGHCKKEQEIKVKQNGKHQRADCMVCGKYIKFVEGADGDFVFWFGKHKGKMFKDIPKDYLIWVRDNIDNKKLRIKIERFLYEKS